MNALHWGPILAGFAFAGSLASAQPAIKLAVLPAPFEIRNPPAGVTIAGPDRMSVRAGKNTNWFASPWDLKNWDNVPTLLFRPDENFTLSAKIALSPVSLWDSGALVLFADKDHWAKLCLEMPEPNGPLSVVSVVTNDVSDDGYSIQAKGDALYMRVSKSGPGLSFYASEDGQNWKLIRAFRFRATAPVQAGFLAQSPVGAGISVEFSDIRYSRQDKK